VLSGLGPAAASSTERAGNVLTILCVSLACSSV
jgi:hypothetical protein